VTERRLQTLIDTMRIPVDGDPEIALLSIGERTPVTIECDVLVVGGGTGGVAAALAAARNGCQVCLLEETDWVGGQFTSQGVSALDEHAYIETFGGTASYYHLRNSLRDIYRKRATQVAKDIPFNPGNCWVTNLAFEPGVAAGLLDQLLAESGNISVYRRAKVAAASTVNNIVVWVEAVSLVNGDCWRFHPRFVLDATELGDLLPLTGAEHRVGAETIHETGEPHAQPNEHRRHCVQSFTYTFALERRPSDESHLIPKPSGYEHYRKSQPYGLTIEVHGGEIYGEESGNLSYTIFEQMSGTKGGLWTYRRLIDREQFGGTFAADITMINWPGNDYREGSLIDGSPVQIVAALQAAKCCSLGFLHWLQTEAPADPLRFGAPELKLRPDIMGSADGLSKFPYIREGRRLIGLVTITEQDLSIHLQKGPRANHFPDSVGIGWYPIDIHRVAGDVGVSTRTYPFQIPLGALVPKRISNLLAAGKNIGTTHISNGCYRLHPVEWNIGESAGTLAAHAIKTGASPREIREDTRLLRSFQRLLVHQGIPIAWIVDVPQSHPAFAATQVLHMDKLFAMTTDLCFEPDKSLTIDEWVSWGGSPTDIPASRAAGALQLYDDR
jgi:hypothetical protein